MNGKVIVSGLLGVALIAGAGLWYSIERAYYTRVTGVSEVRSYDALLPVSDYVGIDADTSPLKMRACFKVNWEYTLLDNGKMDATPLLAPRFFSCFDAGKITTDLEAGKAAAVLLDENRPYGFNTYVAQYPDGRAFMWRQINACGNAWFNGNDLPEGCPEPSTIIIEEMDPTVIIKESKASEPVELILRDVPRFVRGRNNQEVNNHG
jgi:hypothetical protein